MRFPTLKWLSFRLVVSQLLKVPLKVIVLGLTRMLTRHDMMQQPDIHTWYSFRVYIMIILILSFCLHRAGNVYRASRLFQSINIYRKQMRRMQGLYVGLTGIGFEEHNPGVSGGLLTSDRVSTL